MDIRCNTIGKKTKYFLWSKKILINIFNKKAIQSSSTVFEQYLKQAQEAF